VSWALLNCTNASSFVLFQLLNRTRVHDRHRFGAEANTLLCANHLTMIDSYMLSLLSAWPRGLRSSWHFPYHPAAKENFFRNEVLSWVSRHWKCIPVRRGAHDTAARAVMERALKSGQMLIFPEGSRSRTGELLKGRPGTGKLIHDTRCKVVPIYHRGMRHLLPVGARWPRIGKRLEVYVGEPVKLDDLFQLPPCKETSELIVARVMAAIGELQARARAERQAR